MPKKNINLTDHNSDFVDKLIANGNFKNTSEVVRAALKLLEQQTTEDEQKILILRKLAKEGFDQIDQGEGIVLQGKDQISTHITMLGKKASKLIKNEAKH